jgi:uncharacterized iron-regulated protein
MRTLLLLSLLTLGLTAFVDKPAYRLYDRKGQPTEYAALLRQAQAADVVLFGELHNNPICHWLQLELTQDLFTAKAQPLVLGAEMFEADNQLVLDEYLGGTITAAQLEAEAKVWKNYPTDYKPLVDFARQHRLPFVATNVPRRYASIVSKKGLEGLNELSPDARRAVAPLPVTVDLTLPGYAELLKMGGMHGPGMGGMTAENIARAQALKDATMAHFILRNWKRGQTFVHFNGSYHSQHFEGIGWYLKRANPALNVVTIATVEETDILHPTETKPDLAHFVLTVPKTMTKTH